MNTKSIHNNVNLILKNFDKGEKEAEKYYKDYDRAWKLLEKFYKDYDKEGRVQEVALKELSQLNISLKKGIN
jgi:hypothetical protein